VSTRRPDLARRRRQIPKQIEFVHARYRHAMKKNSAKKTTAWTRLHPARTYGSLRLLRRRTE
jgi:hypothetical protein